MPTSSYLFLNGHRFHYLNWGGGSGRPLVLLHGLASNARIWDAVAPRLAGNFHVLALDQRGHGLSDVPEEGYAPATILRDLHAFIEGMHLERPVLVGHSWGANTVLHYAAARPANVAGIALVDGGMGEMSSIPGLNWETAEPRLTPPPLAGMPRDEFLVRLREWAGELYSEAVADAILGNFEILEDDTIRPHLPLRHHMRIARSIYEQKTSELFPRLRCPTLLCPAVPPPPRDDWVEQLLAAKRRGVALAEQSSPLVRTVWFEDTVHDIPLHRPKALARAILEFGGPASNVGGVRLSLPTSDL